ncbi:MAG TPA: hypothetical protein VFY16_06980, partial [Gemmatimonadaceae bacterium]|nr:hypothetical protein [Gemmatimonadaceae bacterium]
MSPSPVVVVLLLLLGAVLGAAIAWMVAALRHRAATAALAVRLEERERAAAERAAGAAHVEERLRETFEALSAEALRRNATSFLQLAGTAFGEQRQAASAELA